MKTIYKIGDKHFSTLEAAEAYKKCNSRFDKLVAEMIAVADKFEPGGGCDCSKYCNVKGVQCPGTELDEKANQLTWTIRNHAQIEPVTIYDTEGEALL